jgi:hypothetical protein
MDERRKSKRTDLKSKLIAKRLDSSEQREVGVDVLNVSKTGIGFEAYLTIWTSEVLHAFIEIVRIEKIEDGYNYGGLFIGMPELDLQRIDVYNIVSEANK